MSMNDERKLIKAIEDLEKSLPHAVPLADNDKKIDELNKEKKQK